MKRLVYVGIGVVAGLLLGAGYATPGDDCRFSSTRPSWLVSRYTFMPPMERQMTLVTRYDLGPVALALWSYEGELVEAWTLRTEQRFIREADFERYLETLPAPDIGDHDHP